VSSMFEFHVGLTKPETADEVREQSEINGMRAALNKAERDLEIVSSCFQMAYHRGLSGEDKYVLLAYHALLRYEETFQQLNKFINLHPAPRNILYNKNDENYDFTPIFDNLKKIRDKDLNLSEKEPDGWLHVLCAKGEAIEGRLSFQPSDPFGVSGRPEYQVISHPLYRNRRPE